MDEDISKEQKTWQVYSFGKRNVFRLDLNESREGFCQRGRGRSFHVEWPKTEKVQEPTVESLVLFPFAYVMSGDNLLKFQFWVHPYGKCPETGVSGSLRVRDFLRPFLGGTRTGSTNSPAGKPLNKLKESERHKLTKKDIYVRVCVIMSVLL